MQPGLAPYLAGGALASGASLALTPKRNKVYVELTYRSLAGIPSRTEGHWVNVRQPSIIDIHNPVDGWVDVTVAALPKQGLRIQQLTFVGQQSQPVQSNISQFHEMSSTPPTNNTPADTTQTKPKKSSPPTGGAMPSKEAPPPGGDTGGGGIWLPEVTVVGHYNGDEGGDTGQSWGGFVGGFQNADPSLGGNDPNFYSGAMQSSNGNAYSGGQTSPPDRNSFRDNAARRPSFCNGRNDMWRWSYGNNNTYTTVEFSGFILNDGSFIQLPWSRNAYNSCSYWTDGTYFDDGNAVYQYSVQVRNGQLVLLAQNKFNNYTKLIPIVGYVHTHPFTGPDQNGVNYNIYNPTPKLNPGANDPNDYGDWQLAHDYGIPGYIVTQDQVVKYSWDPTQSNPQKVDYSMSNQNFCNPSHEP